MDGNVYQGSTLNIPDVIAVLKGAGEAYQDFIKELEELHNRLNQGTFHFAVLGQFKRGKSTFINALLGEKLLPTSILPLTAIPTFIRYGDHYRLRVNFLKKTEDFSISSPEELSDKLNLYVTEKNNPENKLGVLGVDVFVPARILKAGLVLIDTPGVGSTFLHNTDTTLKTLPKIDAAFFVVSVDPPITQSELEFLKDVRGVISTIFFILNKIDTLEQRDRVDAIDFLKNILRTNLGIDPVIFAISAKQALLAKINNNKEAFKNSKMYEIESFIQDFMAKGKEKTLVDAIHRKGRAVLDRALLSLKMEFEGLNTPVKELDTKIQLFKEKSREIKEKSQVIEDLLEGEKRRILKRLDERAGEIRAKARKDLMGFVEQTINEFDGQQADLTKGLYMWVEERLYNTIPEYFDREFRVVYEEFSNLMQEAMNRHYQEALKIILEIQREATQIFDIAVKNKGSNIQFEMPPAPYWASSAWHYRLGPIRTGLFDRLFPVSVLKNAVKKRMQEDLRMIVNKNVENIRWPMNQAIINNFAAFISRLNVEIDQVVTDTQSAINRAIELKISHQEEVASRVELLKGVIEMLEKYI